MTGVIDYKAGNLRSVETALQYIGARYFVSDDPEKLLKSDKLIFPGVGHAGAAIDRLNELGMAEMIRQYAETGKHIFGICLGSQIFMDGSEEGNTPCIGLIPGSTRLLPPKGLKIPQIGWNQVKQTVKHHIFNEIDDNASFYFVHSYYTEPADKKNVLCETDYGFTFASGVFRDNICAVQFHPEKSGKFGLKMLENFIKS